MRRLGMETWGSLTNLKEEETGQRMSWSLSLTSCYRRTLRWVSLSVSWLSLPSCVSWKLVMNLTGSWIHPDQHCFVSVSYHPYRASVILLIQCLLWISEINPRYISWRHPHLLLLFPAQVIDSAEAACISTSGIREGGQWRLTCPSPRPPSSLCSTRSRSFGLF